MEQNRLKTGISTHHTILLVEDDPGDVELTRRAFSMANLQAKIVIARDGHEAIHTIFGLEPDEDSVPVVTPGLILLDLKLPKKSGHEVLEILRKNRFTKSIPVVVLTNSNDSEDIEHAYRVGANSYVRKILDFRQFADAIKEIENYWLRVNVAPELRIMPA